MNWLACRICGWTMPAADQLLLGKALFSMAGISLRRWLGLKLDKVMEWLPAGCPAERLTDVLQLSDGLMRKCRRTVLDLFAAKGNVHGTAGQLNPDPVQTPLRLIFGQGHSALKVAKTALSLMDVKLLLHPRFRPQDCVRYFVAKSLAEGETMRRILHGKLPHGPPLAPANLSIGLRSLTSGFSLLRALTGWNWQWILAVLQNVEEVSSELRRGRERLLNDLTTLTRNIRSRQESGSTEVSFENSAQPKEMRKLEKQVQDLHWRVNVLRARSKKDQKKKRFLMKKNAHLQNRIYMYEGYWKRCKLQEKTCADLREEAEELRQKIESDSELLKEMDEALHYRLKEVDELNLSAQIMSTHIKQLEGGLVATNLVEMEEAEELPGSHCRTRSLPPRPEEKTEKRAKVKAIVQYPVELEPRQDHEDYGHWANAQIIRLREGAINVNRLVRELREGSAEAVRLRMHGIAGN